MTDTPAFPPNAGWRDNDPSARGMTLRQYAAIHIMAGLAADPETGPTPVRSLSVTAVIWADGLLAALERSDEK